MNTLALTEAGALAVSDPGSTRLVYAMVISLVVVGVVLVVLGIWLIRQTRADPEMLAPLERMGDRQWRRSDPATQLRLLDEVRPEDAEPLATHQPQPRLDTEFGVQQPPEPLDDLGPGIPGDGDDTPPGLPEPSAAIDDET